MSTELRDSNEDVFWYGGAHHSDSQWCLLASDYAEHIVDILAQMNIDSKWTRYRALGTVFVWIDIIFSGDTATIAVNTWKVDTYDKYFGITLNRKEFLQKLLRMHDEYAATIALINNLPQPIAEEITPEITFYWRIRDLLGIPPN